MTNGVFSIRAPCLSAPGCRIWIFKVVLCCRITRVHVFPPTTHQPDLDCQSHETFPFRQHFFFYLLSYLVTRHIQILYNRLRLTNRGKEMSCRTDIHLQPDYIRCRPRIDSLVPKRGVVIGDTRDSHSGSGAVALELGCRFNRRLDFFSIRVTPAPTNSERQPRGEYR